VRPGAPLSPGLIRFDALLRRVVHTAAKEIFRSYGKVQPWSHMRCETASKKTLPTSDGLLIW
jgi:hypothetical protein